MGVEAEGLSQAEHVNYQADNWARALEDKDTAMRIAASKGINIGDLAALASDWREWACQPGAILVTHWFFAVAFK